MGERNIKKKNIMKSDKKQELEKNKKKAIKSSMEL
jgi:hypothetical protein